MILMRRRRFSLRRGWSLVFQTPPESGDPLACVALADAQVLLGISLPEFLPTESRAHKGAGVEIHVTVTSADIDAVLLGYRFLIAAGG